MLQGRQLKLIPITSAGKSKFRYNSDKILAELSGSTGGDLCNRRAVSLQFPLVNRHVLAYVTLVV
jgi:hypothetical protein